MIGIDFKGATLELEVKGKDQTVSLAGKAAIAANLLGEGKDSAALPSLLVRDVPIPIKLTKAEATGEGKLSTLAVMNPDYLDKNRLPDFQTALEAGANLALAVKVNLGPILPLLPVVGPPLAGLNESGALKIDALFEMTVGGKVKTTRTTYLPVPAGLLGTVSGPTEIYDLLGGKDQVTNEIKLIFRAAAGLSFSALGGVAEGAALLQLGAPATASDKTGIALTIGEKDGFFPVFKKLEGAFSFIGRIALNLYVVRLSKEFQYDFKNLTMEFGSEPVFELVPLGTTTTIVRPSGWPPERFLRDAPAAGASGPQTLVQGFYPAGSVAAVAAGQPVTVYTGVDTNGQMVVYATTGAADGSHSAPIAVGSAPGVASVAAASGMVAGADGVIAVWSTIADADLGDPYAGGALWAATSSDGVSWSAPVKIGDASSVPIGLRLERAGNETLLVWLEARAGPLASDKRVMSAAWDGAAWSAPVEAVPEGPLVGFDVAGAPAATAAGGSPDGTSALLVTSSGGKVAARSWDGSAWAAPEELADGAADGVAAEVEADGRLSVAWEETSGAIDLSVADAGAATWSALGAVIAEAGPLELHARSVTIATGEHLTLLVWVAGGAQTSIWFALVDASGAVWQAPTEATPDSAGRYAALSVRVVDGAHAEVTARYIEGDAPAASGDAALAAETVEVRRVALALTPVAPPPPDAEADSDADAAPRHHGGGCSTGGGEGLAWLAVCALVALASRIRRRSRSGRSG